LRTEVQPQIHLAIHIRLLLQNRSDKNPQSAVVENVKQQEMFVELKKMIVIVTKNA